jgi:hypothetical protein
VYRELADPYASAWFDIIALATSKGGVGKSTLGRSLAAHWLGLGRKPALAWFSVRLAFVSFWLPGHPGP